MEQFQQKQQLYQLKQFLDFKVEYWQHHSNGNFFWQVPEFQRFSSDPHDANKELVNSLPCLRSFPNAPTTERWKSKWVKWRVKWVFCVLNKITQCVYIYDYICYYKM